MGKYGLDYPYLKVADDIRKKVVAGKIAEGSRLDSVRKLTKIYGRSYNTIVKAIDTLVHEGYLETRERQGIYVSEGMGGKICSRKIGVVILNVHYQSFGPESFAADSSLSGLKCVHHNLAMSNNRVVIQGCMYRREPGANEWDYVPASELAYTMDGIILAGLYNFDYVTSFTRLETKSLISYDVDASALGIDSVFMDDLQSSFDMTSMLIKRGHKKIAFIGRDLGGSSTRVPADPCVFAREDGYKLALSSGRTMEPFVYNCENRDSYGESLTTILDEHPDLTGVVSETPFEHDAFTKRGVELATWTSKVNADNDLSDQVALVAACDFIKMGEAALDLLFDSIRESRRGVKRVKIQPEIRELK